MLDILESSAGRMELIVKIPLFQGFDNVYMIPSTQLSEVIIGYTYTIYCMKRKHGYKIQIPIFQYCSFLIVHFRYVI